MCVCFCWSARFGARSLTARDQAAASSLATIPPKTDFFSSLGYSAELASVRLSQRGQAGVVATLKPRRNHPSAVGAARTKSAPPHCNWNGSVNVPPRNLPPRQSQQGGRASFRR